MMLEEVSLSELPIFFNRSMLLAWRTVFRVERDVDDQGFWTPVEPLFFNPMIQTRLLSSVSVRTCLPRNGVLKLGYILDERGWKSREALQEITGLKVCTLCLKIEGRNL